ncbi:hypothetical protein GCM10010399_13270 [Dactylosporangium fulvum]|uniref:histidine kinase n=1 Tax=Dactylosporangium fulvum TaxID=53359 RepID=A0ABY5W7G9_9ACTN|nr:DUF4118 domain-containing protein [Dactylosporangium fulvum]UWP85251.1 DUF4118 domain-containing protein [Dactylosporangium fulvum]
MPARLTALLLSHKRPPLALGLIVAAVLIAAETAVLFPLRAGSEVGARSVVYLCGVLVVSSVWGVWLGVVTSVASTAAFNYFHVAPFEAFSFNPRQDLQTAAMFIGAGLFTSFVTNLARSRAAEASERRREADLAADMAHRMLRADDVRSTLGPVSQLLAEAFELRSAAVELDAVAGDERWVAFPLRDSATQVGTLLVPANAPERTLERLRHRVVPSLVSLLCAAREREEITDSLKASREEATRLMEASTLLMEEQAALRRVAILVARGSSPPAVFSTVTSELCQLLGPYSTGLVRYEPDGTGTLLAGRHEPGMAEMPAGTCVRLEGNCLSGMIKRTGRPARTTYDNAEGPTAAILRGLGIRSGFGVPVVVEGRLWGAAVVSSTRSTSIPAEVEARLADFTELVATAVANADSRAQLTASRARIVAATDEARRRLERDLHDGAQQQLVSLGLQLGTVEAAIPPGLDTVREELAAVATGLTCVLEDLREISRGIHPAMLARGGLGPALRTLARRSTVPVDLVVDIDRRLPERVEVTAYYVVSEALTNAAKHARATVVHVDAEAEDAVLRLSIKDDGVGGAGTGRGSGLIGLQDRVETLGGRMDIVSPTGNGTALLVTIPIDGT